MSKHIELLSQQTTKALVEQFALTENIKDNNIYAVRGWIMEELERRAPKAMDAFLDDWDEEKTLYQHISDNEGF